MKIEPDLFGVELKEIRELAGETQATLAKRSGLTSNYISLLENGDRQPSLEAVNKLAQALGVPANCLLFLGGKTSRAFSALAKEVRASIKEAIRSQYSE